MAEWQTRATQNREGNRGGSSPLTGIRNPLVNGEETSIVHLYSRRFFVIDDYEMPGEIQ